MMLIRASEQAVVEAPEDCLVMRALVQAGHGLELSVTHVRLSGRHRPLRTARSNRVYYVLEGSGKFWVGDGRAVVAHAGDVVAIPRGERYRFAGDLAYLVLNSPAFVDGDDLYEDE